MPNPSFIFKNRLNTYYFRQKTPKKILQQLPSAKKEVKISLKTKEKSKALVLARLHKTSFDMLFREITEGAMFIQSSKEAFLELSEAEKRTKLLKIRAAEAIQDQRYTQQLFFLFERKNRLKNLFNNFDDLQGCSLTDVDLSSIDKINHFIAIADLLTDETLSDPSVYLEQIKWKPAPKQQVDKPEIKKMYKSIKLNRLVINRNKKQNKSINNPTELKRQSTSARRQVGTALVGLLDSEISEKNHITAIRTQTDDIKTSEDLVLEGISLDTEQDVVNFAKLMGLLEKGGDVQVSDFESFSKPVVVPKSMLKMSELFAKFYKERSAEWNSMKTHSTNKSIYNTFLEIIGDIFVDEFNGSYANQFVDTLQELPANRNKLKAYRDKSITDILALKGTFEAMKAANANKYIERVSDVLEWAKSRHYISENLLKTMKIKDKNQKVKYKDERQRFDADDLTQIFNSDKYLQGKHTRTYQFWLPLLGLYSGARLQELSQLRINDVYMKNSVWVLDINDDEDKQVKNVNSTRLIPVHKSLISLGFIKYIDFLKLCYEEGFLKTTLVFPDLVKGRDGYGHNSAKWFSRYLVQINVKEKGKSFHSLRHTFGDEMKQSLANQVMTAELMGHAIEGETFSRYGKNYAITTLKKAIDQYAPLDSKQLKVIRKFKFWKEFSLINTMLMLVHIVDDTKSIYTDKNLLNALKGRIAPL